MEFIGSLWRSSGGVLADMVVISGLLVLSLLKWLLEIRGLMQSTTTF